MIGIFLSIWVALLKALSDLASKIVVQWKDHNNLDEYSLALGIRTIVIFPLFFIFLYQGIFLPIWFDTFTLILLWGIGNAITTVIWIKAVKYGDLSLVWPLSSLTIPFLIFTGFLINSELPNTYGIIGVLLIFLGTYFLWISDIKWWFLAPIRNIANDTWARYMILASIIWSITAPIDKLWIQAIGVIPWLFYFNICISAFIFLYIISFRRNIDLKYISSIKNIRNISITALLLGWASFLQVLAIKYTLVVYVVSVKRSSGAFSVLLWALYLKEKNIWIKLFATCVMIMWILCIVLWGNI